MLIMRVERYLLRGYGAEITGQHQREMKDKSLSPFSSGHFQTNVVSHTPSPSTLTFTSLTLLAHTDALFASTSAQ